MLRQTVDPTPGFDSLTGPQRSTNCSSTELSLSRGRSVDQQDLVICRIARTESLGDREGGRIGRYRSTAVGEDGPELPAVHKGARHAADGRR